MKDRNTQALDRRAFLAHTGCAAVAAVAAPSLARPGTMYAWSAAEPTGKTPWKMRLSTSTMEFSSLSVEKTCEQIAALGFEGVNFWNPIFNCPHLDEIEKRLGPQGLKDLLAKHKLKLYSFTCYDHLGKGIAYPRYAELFGKAGGGVAVRESRVGVAKNVAVEMKAFLEARKPELELAEKNNAYLAVENHVGWLLNSLDSFKAFVNMNRHPRLGIALAPHHLQPEKTSVEEVIGIVGKQLLFFYAWQNAPGMGQLPGVGPTDFTPWIAALAKADYAWYVNPFMHQHPARGNGQGTGDRQRVPYEMLRQSGGHHVAMVGGRPRIDYGRGASFSARMC